MNGCKDFTYVRNLAKGKSFNFTPWNTLLPYTNNSVKQDFVTFDGCLYACLKDVAVGSLEPPLDPEHWVLAVNGITQEDYEIIERLLSEDIVGFYDNFVINSTLFVEGEIEGEDTLKINANCIYNEETKTLTIL